VANAMDEEYYDEEKEIAYGVTNWDQYQCPQLPAANEAAVANAMDEEYYDEEKEGLNVDITDWGEFCDVPKTEPCQMPSSFEGSIAHTKEVDTPNAENLAASAGNSMMGTNYKEEEEMVSGAVWPGNQTHAEVNCLTELSIAQLYGLGIKQLRAIARQYKMPDPDGDQRFTHTWHEAITAHLLRRRVRRRFAEQSSDGNIPWLPSASHLYLPP